MAGEAFFRRDPDDPNVFHTNKTWCPACRGLLDSASDPMGTLKLPKDGDRSICWHCMAPLAVQVDQGRISYRLLTEEELREFLREAGREYAATVLAKRRLRARPPI